MYLHYEICIRKKFSNYKIKVYKFRLHEFSHMYTKVLEKGFFNLIRTLRIIMFT